MASNAKPPDSAKLDRIVAEARRASDLRATGYREQALKIYPWICGRCAREFDRSNVRELTVHHRDHNHDNNPPDGSNWELLCVYCHDNEHSRQLEAGRAQGSSGEAPESRCDPQAVCRFEGPLEGQGLAASAQRSCGARNVAPGGRQLCSFDLHCPAPTLPLQFPAYGERHLMLCRRAVKRA